MAEPVFQNKSAADRVAGAVRIVTVPPLMVAVIFAILYAVRGALFGSAEQLMFSVLFLAGVPGLAYPLSYLIPSIRRKGRSGQRSLAMYLSAAGYFSAVLYGFLAQCTEGLKIIHLTYLFSVLLLLVLNKLLHVRASGHACSVSGPILLLCIYVGAIGVAVGLMLWTLIFWASVRMRHHTPKEYLIGSTVPILAYVLSYLIFMAV